VFHPTRTRTQEVASVQRLDPTFRCLIQEAIPCVRDRGEAAERVFGFDEADPSVQDIVPFASKQPLIRDGQLFRNEKDGFGQWNARDCHEGQ
jgi:hypothetical protein